MSLAAALLGALLIALLVGLALAWRWFTRNRDRLVAPIERWRQRLRVRHPHTWAFVAARFARGEYLGLHLTVGFAICVAALGVFGALTEDVIHHDPITEFDMDVVHWFNQHATPSGHRICEAISSLGSPLTITLLALGVAILLGARRQWILLGGWLAALSGASVLDQGLKLVIRRPRPSHAEAVAALGWSFPSGHAMESLVVYGLLAYLIVTLWAQRPSVRTWVVTGALVLVVSIGFSRLYLGVHFFSDVVGGYAVGILWLSACLSGLEVVRRWRATRSAPPRRPPPAPGSIGAGVLVISLLAAPAWGSVTTPADTLRGVVMDSARVALAGAVVRVADLNVAVVSRSDGSFLFPQIAPGRYTVVVQRPGYVPAVLQVTVPPTSALTVVLQPSALDLAPVTITATRSAIDPLTSPLPTSELTGEQLRRHQDVSLSHALDGLPGVRTLSTGEQVGKPIVRGLSGPRVLVLDNGIRLEDYSWSDEDGPSVDAQLAERVEVIRGPGSVLYGSDAIGGVINVIPGDVPDGRGRASFVRGAAELYGATNNGEIGSVLRVDGASGRLGWRVTGIGRGAGDFHTPTGNDSTPTGDLYNTGFHAINGDAVVGLNTDRGNVTLRDTRYGGDFGLLDGPPVPEDAQNGPLRRLSDNRLQLTSNTALGQLRLETKSQWQRHSLEEVSDESRNGDVPATFDLLLNTVSTDVLIHHTAGGWLNGTVGVSGLYQDNQTRGSVPLVPAARTAGIAVFAFEAAAVGRWTFVIGARADAVHLNADSNATLQVAAQTRDAAAVTGDVGAVYRATRTLVVAANVGRAFRAPTLFELFTNGPHLGEDRYEIGLPTATPEVTLNGDLSVRWQSTRARAELAVYRNQINGYLYIAPTGRTDAASGLPIYHYAQAQALLAGAEASGELEVGALLSLRARIDGVRGTNQDTNEPLPLVPPPRGDLEVELHRARLSWAERAYVSAGMRLVAEQTRLGPFDTPTPAYQLLDLGGGLESRVGGRPIRFDVAVRNAANARYTDYLSRYKIFAYGAGRNVIVRLSSGL